MPERNKKTALREVIEKWESEIGSYMPHIPIYRAFIEEAKEYLEKEKQQIVAAYEKGASDFSETGKEVSRGDAEEYFEEQYSK